MKKSLQLLVSLTSVIAITLAFTTFDLSRSNGATAITSKVISATSNSVSVQVTSAANGKVYIEYGPTRSKYELRTAVHSLIKGKPFIFTISNLEAEKKIYYRVRYLLGTKKVFSTTVQAYATTTKVGAEFVFAIQADPHMDGNSSAEVFNSTLAQIVKTNPAFLMDLGDIFMTDKLPDKSEAAIRTRFQYMKSFYDKLGTIPFYFTLGNHDGELGYSNFNTKKYRQEYFPQQTPELAYYSFNTPNSIHIVLDIFTYTTTNPKDDGWQWTLGKTQYDWLKTTLENSTAEHKFVYVHHLLYGNAQSRGGSEKAKFNEWGGLNIDGTDGFASNRPGWAMPIHQLLVKNEVDFVFKGHDHIYVKQELDGIIYQTLPQPSHPGEKISSAAEYGYENGKVIGGSGYLKVTTTSQGISVDFIKHDGTVLDTYTKSQ